MGSCVKNIESFVDLEKCVALIDDLVTKKSNLTDDERIDVEKTVEDFRKLTDIYLQLPELLDPHLDVLISKLTSGLKCQLPSSIRYHGVFKLLYQIIKITGFKSIGKRFPHEIDKLPMLVDMLSKENPEDKAHWESRFVITIWLSIVILAPFDLKKFDSQSKEPIAERLYSLLIRGLAFHDSCQQVTAFCLAKFFSRTDMLNSGKLLDEFISQALDEIANAKVELANSSDDIKLIGYLRALAYMYKFCPRQEMKTRSPAIIEVLVKPELERIDRVMIHHLIIKLSQRAVLSLLPAGEATWKYKRASRIVGSLGKSQPEKEDQQATGGTVDDEIASAEQMEAVLSVLLLASQDSQTKVRWSAAKGIARAASRLSKERANDVIDMILERFFKPTSGECSWHGGCLTLAEMSRHGLILEDKLAQVIKVVDKAIVFDRIKGCTTVGAHVREAACYVCWAMARAYEDHVIAPHVNELNVNLLCVILFDRELQCRRAASGTFQELIGRQGTFSEEKISILTALDYHNVGQRQLCYLDLATKVASFGREYSVPFVMHLLEMKLAHWDIEIRRLASDCLSALMLHVDASYIRTSVLPKLMQMTDSDTDLNQKHGAILGLAKVIRGLVPLAYDFEPELCAFVGSLADKCEKQLKSKQQGGKFLEVIVQLISSAELAKFSYADDSPTIKRWESIALTALDSDDAKLRQLGADAYLTLYKSYYRSNKTNQDRLLTVANRNLESPNESTRCGALQALAKLGQVNSTVTLDGDSGNNSSASTGAKLSSCICLDADIPDIVLMSFASYIKAETHEPKTDFVFASAKAQACESLVDFVYHLDDTRLLQARNLIISNFDALLVRSEDYTFDKRGDIGVVVRRAAVKALLDLTLYLSRRACFKSMFDSNRCTSLLAKILQQAVSLNDTCREIAAQAFYKLIVEAELPDDCVPHKAAILELFDKYQAHDASYNWRNDSIKLMVELVGYAEFCTDLWLGLIPSCGQISEMGARPFRASLASYLRSLDETSNSASRATTKRAILDSLVLVLDQIQIGDRLLMPALLMLDHLLIEELLDERIAEQLASFCWSRKGASGDPKRITAVAKVLSSLLQFRSNQDLQERCLKYCVDLLLNGYVRVRAYMAEQLYLSMLSYQADGDGEPETPTTNSDCQQSEQTGKLVGERRQQDFEAAMELLSQTNWSQPLDKLRPVRDQICQSLSIE